ncbi:MAG: VanW family protein [Lachnospiraceae bacterium]|nr:VanW family protein [Lachnospiraceae bacterium]
MFVKKYAKQITIAAGCGALVLGGLGYQMAAKADVNYNITIRKANQNVVFQRGISIEGQSLEGMTLQQAADWVNTYVSEVQNRKINLSAFDNVFEYNGSSFGMTWSNPELVNDLSAYLTAGNFVEQYKLQKDLDANPVNLDIQLTYDESAVRSVVQNLADTYYAAPVDATTRRENGAWVVSPEIIGQEFDVEAIMTDLTALISDYDNHADINYDMPCIITEPNYTSADFAYSAQPLGSYATGNLGTWERTTNITIAAQRINGTIVYPGQEMSTNAIYDVSKENGYQIAPGYENGQQVPALGGGTCQSTTTLYNALLNAEVTITERSPHSMIVTYVPPALDAAVAVGGKDLKFRNDYSHPIYLESYIYDGQIHVVVWGIEERPANRRVAYRPEVLECVFYPASELYNVVVDNSQVVYGPTASVGQKITAPVETHPKVVAKSYKQIYIDGVLVEEQLLNYDSYAPMKGLMYIASDCNVTSYAYQCAYGTGVYPYLSFSIHHTVTFKNGEDWNPNTAAENYTP